MQTHTLQLERPLQNVSLHLAGVNSNDATIGGENTPPVTTSTVPSTAAEALEATQPERESTDTSLVGLQELVTRIDHACVQHRDRQTHALNELRAAAVKLAIEIADIVVTQAVEYSSARLESMIRDALVQFEHAAQITVRLNPADLERLSNVGFQTGGLAELNLVGDPAIALGDCHLSSPKLTLVADRKRMMQDIEQSVMKEFTS